MIYLCGSSSRKLKIPLRALWICAICGCRTAKTCLLWSNLSSTHSNTVPRKKSLKWKIRKYTIPFIGKYILGGYFYNVISLYWKMRNYEGITATKYQPGWISELMSSCKGSPITSLHLYEVPKQVKSINIYKEYIHSKLLRNW